MPLGLTPETELRYRGNIKSHSIRWLLTIMIVLGWG